MRYSLEQFPSIPESDRQALSAAPLLIGDTDQLLERAGTQARLRSLAGSSGIPFKRLARHACLADLTRVSGVGPAQAELLVAAHAAATVQQLALANPLTLQARIAGFLAETGSQTQLPALEQLQQTCAEAGELRPRLSLRKESHDPKFREKLFAEARVARKHQFLLMLGIVGGVMLLPLALMLAYTYLNVIPNSPQYISAYQDFNQILRDVPRLSFEIPIYSTLVFAAILLGMALILITVYVLISYFSDTWLVLLFFPSPALHRFFKKVNGVDQKKQYHNLWRVVGIFIVVLLLLTGTALYMIFVQEASSSSIMEMMAKFVIPGGVFAAVVAFVPDLRYTLALARRKRYPEEAVKRLCVYRMVNILPIPVLIFLLSRLALPLSLSWHAGIYQERLVPETMHKFAQKAGQMRQLVSTDAQRETTRKYLVYLLEEELPGRLQSISAASQEKTVAEFNGYITGGLNMVIWIVITAFLLYFVVPYLLLGGWQRGIFYMIMIALSYWIGELCVEYSPAWFGLPEDSWGRLPAAAFFVFVTTLFFDWVFGTLVNKSRLCPACQSEQPRQARYCSNCGFQQE